MLYRSTIDTISTANESLYPILSNVYYGSLLCWIVPIVLAKLPSFFPLQVCLLATALRDDRYR